MVKSSSGPGIYLLAGKEEFLKKEFVQNLRKSLFSGTQSPEFNSQEFYVPQDPLTAVVDFARTAPFLSEKRLAVLWGIEGLPDEEKEALLSYADSPSSTTVLVLVAEEGNPKKDAFLGSLSKKSALVSCHPPFERDLPGWIEAHAKKSGASIERDAALLLIERVGKEVALLHQAIEELVVYIHPRSRVALKDVENLLGKSAQSDVFHLADALLEKNIKSALEIVSMLFKEGTRAYEILPALAGQFDRLRKAGDLMGGGRSGQEIGAELRIHSFFLDKFLKQLKSVSGERLKDIFEKLLACDEAIKTSRLSDRIAVEQLVWELCL